MKVSLNDPCFPLFLRTLAVRDATRCVEEPSNFEKEFNEFKQGLGFIPSTEQVFSCVLIDNGAYLHFGNGHYIIVKSQNGSTAIDLPAATCVTCLNECVPAEAFAGLSTDTDRTRKHSSSGHVRLSDQLVIDWN